MLRSTLLLAGLLALVHTTAAGQGAYDALPGNGWDAKIGPPGADPPPMMEPPSVPGSSYPTTTRRTNPFNPAAGNPPAGYAPPAPLPRRAQNVMDMYAGATSQRVLAQLEQRPTSGRVTSSGGTMAPPRPRQQYKPFQGASASPTVSPYLNLFREEDGVELPNYYTFVRPMQEQQTANRLQQAELMRLRRQVQAMPYGAQSTAMRSGTPDTGHGTRYFNTSGYFPAGGRR